ncbi:MAG: 30S ribosome-binding factor RbfA [FCB group bacterium]|nr:30S ribosome-binding factor RbfA [FCB group bacterium]
MSTEKPYRRTDRVGAQVQEILAEIVYRHIDLSHLGFITFSHVDITPDLKIAHVFFSVLQPAKSFDAIENELNGLSKVFRKYLAPELHVKSIPELIFNYDDSYDRQEHLNKIIRKIHQQDNDSESV